MVLEPHVSSKMGLRSWPGAVSLALDLGFFLGCRLRVKSLKSITVELFRHVCSLLGHFSCSFQGGDLLCCSDQNLHPHWPLTRGAPECHAQPAPCGPWVSRTLTPQHTQRQEGWAYSSVASSTRDMVSHRLISVPTGHPLGADLQLTLPCGAAPGISHKHDKDGFSTSFFLGILLRL